MGTRGRDTPAKRRRLVLRVLEGVACAVIGAYIVRLVDAGGPIIVNFLNRPYVLEIAALEGVVLALFVAMPLTVEHRDELNARVRRMPWPFRVPWILWALFVWLFFFVAPSPEKT